MSAAVSWQAATACEAYEVLHDHYALQPHTVERLLRGSVNTVWRLRSPDGDFVLKRLGRRASAGWLEFQGTATARAHDQGVPVQPLVIAVDGRTTVDHNGTQWQLRPYVEGRPCTDGDASDLGKAARCLATVHSVPLDGLSPAAENPVQDLEHWLTTDESGLEEVGRVASAAVPRALWEAVRPALADAYRRARAELDWPLYQALPKTLTHGEFAGSNLVFDDRGDISCVLDWDAVDIRPRAYDLARAALFLGRKRRGGFTVHPNLAAGLLVEATRGRPAEPRELAAIIPILELYCVPTVRYVEQLAEHSPDTLQWYLGWTAEGASMVRATLAAAVAGASARIAR
ncbi:phosphotransferase enzyme family protein [Streptomyces sp. NPDC001890]|uniref:phosphotransferase enzyme family protein n=1 Tax=Streptomyces sp. NPDC001890 TaxID=3364620 RepID=UPI00369A0D8A